MLRDVFYFGNKPNAHPREKPAKNLKDARSQATTDQFWIINEFCDYKNFEWDFDFDFLPDEEVWAEEHINVWPSVYQKDSGTWLVSNNDSEYIIYRNDVERLKRKNVKTDNWVLIDRVDESKFDFGWHPDPTDPPFIYRWGNKYYPVELMGAIEYRVPGATQIKYMNTVAELLPENERWEIPDNIDIDSFDFSWRPDPREPALIYEFGTQWRDNGGPRYICQGATQVKYVDGLKAKTLPNQSDSNWTILPGFNIEHFDYTWHPDNTSPPYIYVFGNQWYDSVTMPTVEYHVPGATERKFVSDCWATLGKNTENWIIPENIDTTDFDFSWIPNPYDPPMTYQFGTQWQKTGGPSYVVEGANEVKYMDNIKALMLANTDNWELSDIVDKDNFDYSWHPDDNDPAYIYVFGNQWYDAETMPTARYTVNGATDVKYINDLKAKLSPKLDNWEIPSNIDVSSFDFSWIPNPYDKPYIYQFGTQWQKTGGPRYIVEGASEVKYIDATKATMLPDMTKWSVPSKVDVSNFDFSWHPDETAPAYIYQFGTQWGDQGGPRYIVDGATEIQYISTVKARADIDFTKWQIPEGLNVDNFDFSWHPSTEDKPYIYQFGTQWQKTGGPRFVCEGATEVKYVDTQRAIKLADPSKFTVLKDYTVQSFDYSWHPDDTEQPYIYQFGNNQYSAEVMPTIEYVVEGASQVKYVNNNIARLGPNKDKWTIPVNIDDTDFDYSWVPHPDDPAYNYVFGTQWQKTGGPEYRVENATMTKYVDSQKVIRLANKSDPAWHIVQDVEIEDFDYSWHPDNSEPPYIYKFGNQHHSVESMPTLEYRVEDADMAKYISDVKVKIKANKNNWIIPSNIDDTGFDYSWVPDPNDPPYVYVAGTQWQKTGGPKFISKGVDLNSPIKYLEGKSVKKLPDTRNFKVITDSPIKNFDYSWHPDETDPPYVYHFGNNLYDAEIMPTIEYVVDGAIHTKYVNDVKATLAPNKSRWIIPEDIDDTGFDYSWVPNPKDPAYIYVSGTQHQKTGGPRYVVENATEVKYLDHKVKKLSNKSKFKLLADVIVDNFDYTWHPDENDPPFIYQFGNNLYDAEVMPTLEYVVPGAIYVKYINDVKVTLGQNKKRWIVPKNIDDAGFDYSWVPNPKDPAYIYVAGTQHQKTGGPKYIVEGATELKYLDIKVKRLPDRTNFNVLDSLRIKDFDYSWHPDETDPPYIYQFGNNLYDAEIMPTIEYRVEGAIHVKYVNDIKATLGMMKYKWQIPKNIDDAGFDYSWVPNPKDPAYIYVSRTQHQKNGGPKFVVDGATSIKYIDQQVTKLPDKSNFTVIADVSIEDFDYSWHPDETDPPYIYQFGNNLYDAETMPTVEYKVGDSLHVKYINEVRATLAPMKHKWTVPNNIDDTGFDYSWVPNPRDPAYIYISGTQHQKTGGPKFIVEGASEVKYLDTHVKRLPDKSNFETVGDLLIEDFDYSWHPDETAPPYIYVFGNQHYQPETMPTIRYSVEGGLLEKFIHEPSAKLAQDKRGWAIPKNIDATDFDFSWKPNPYDLPYIYRFGTQWQKTGGPTYSVTGATEFKYIEGSKARYLSNKNDSRWDIPEGIDVSDFDFSWHPDSTERPYIYEFGTQWQKTGGPRYKVPGATQTKYISELTAKALPKGDNWDIPDGIDLDSFDFSWHPDSTNQPMIYQFGTQHQKTGGPRYIVPGAENSVDVVYIPTSKLKAIRLPNKKNWTVPANIDPSSIDYSWHPDHTEAPYIYHFGTQWNDRGGPTYTVPGATFYKYSNSIRAKLLADKSKFVALIPIEDKFDYTWAPHPDDPPYIYVFGNQWHSAEIEPTVEYRVEGATEYKYVHDIKATVAPDKTNWKFLHKIDEDKFDFSWRPSPKDPPYIYRFGNQWHNAEIMPTVEYVVGDAMHHKYIHDIVATLAQNKDNWHIPANIAADEFDYSWVPDPYYPAKIYQFGTQWQRNGGPKYVMKDATDITYVDVKAKRLPTKDNWTIPENVGDFDYSWHPDEDDPPYIYKFAMEYDTDDNLTGPVYTVPGAEYVKIIKDITAKIKVAEEVQAEEQVVGQETEIEEFVDAQKYVITVSLDDLVYEHPNEVFWAIRDNIDYSNFDFNWRPNNEQGKYRYVHVFGSPDSQATQTFLVNAPMYRQGFTDLNFVEGQKTINEEYLATLFKPNDMFFVDRGNVEAKDRYERLKEKYPSIQKTRFLNSWVDTINRCINRSNTELCWILNSELDYTGFNFNYYPNQWQTRMVHVFGTQWSQWGTTFLVNRDTFAIDTKYIKIVEHLSNLNFVKDRKATATNNLYDIVLVDHGNGVDTAKATLASKIADKQITVVNYDKDYLTTMKNIVKQLPAKKEHYVWVCSSVCDYSDFDFTYITDPFARDNLHVFPSNNQKFGDTFMMDVNVTREVLNNITDLKDYPKIAYTNTIRSKRLNAPVVKVESDTHVGSLNTDFDFPYMIFTTENIEAKDDEPISLWDDTSKTILVTSTGASRIIVPREAKDIVKNELYDYPYIKTSSRLSKSKPLDIVFLSNGELCADENYEHLLQVTKGTGNRVLRVDGIDGRVEAYHAALTASETPWAFTVFAKLKVNSKFDWNWQPDRLQIPKHYIFHSRNPLNGLEYGHQGMIAYNKKLTLNNTGKGLDFTLDDPHETVELLSGVATFNTDPYSTWRTAFREVIKLQSDYSDIAVERLNLWLNTAEGEYAEDCLRGAKDAVEYYDSVMGDIEELKKSYEWAWLKEFYRKKYK